MSRSKFSPDVYTALRDAGMSNRQIGKELDVNEASVRRGLKDAPASRPKTTRRVLLLIEEQ